MKGLALRGNEVSFGDLGIKALEPGWITAKQIEACRITLTRILKKDGKLWIRIFPDKSYTKKPAETRQGKGKGDLAGWVSVVKPGRMLFEVASSDEKLNHDALVQAGHKLGVKTKIVGRRSL